MFPECFLDLWYTMPRELGFHLHGRDAITASVPVWSRENPKLQSLAVSFISRKYTSPPKITPLCLLKILSVLSTTGENVYDSESI